MTDKERAAVDRLLIEVAWVVYRSDDCEYEPLHKAAAEVLEMVS